MVYGAIYGAQNSLEEVAVRLTYYQVDTDKIFYFTRNFARQELDDFLLDLLNQYTPGPGARFSGPKSGATACKTCCFPIPSTESGSGRWPGKFTVPAAPAGGRQGRVSAVLPGSHRNRQNHDRPLPCHEGHGGRKMRKLFYFTARTTARTAAEGAVALLRQKNPGLSFRSVTLTAKKRCA